MRARALLRLTCPALILFFAAFSYSQSAPAPPTTSAPIQIIYTGKLQGYFRMRAGQKRNLIGCQPRSDSTDSTLEDSPDFDSRAATKFLAQRRMNKDAILVGTGDSFAPQLEAREFYRDPAHRVSTDIDYSPENKELFYGSDNGWIFYKTKQKNSEIDQLINRIDSGVGTIPSDNVACFLAGARFAAIVPGKHDFYFGAERVRELARFMAGLREMEKLNRSAKLNPELSDEEQNEKPPQMLGANLVIKPVRIDGQVTRADLRSTPWFSAEWPKDHGQVTNIQEGGSVYPWLSTVHLRLMAFQRNSNVLADLLKFIKDHTPKDDHTPTEDLLEQFVNEKTQTPGSNDTSYPGELAAFKTALENVRPKSIYVCSSKGDPNDLKKPYLKECALLPKRIRISGSSVIYDLPLPIEDPKLVDPNKDVDKDLTASAKDKHFSLLTPDKNYGLCMMLTNAKQDKEKEPQTNCIRFSVHIPFFYYPYSRPTVVRSNKNTPYYTDPDPFVFLEANGNRPYDAAIFGVVDPHLGEQVGVLNFSWSNKNDELKTLVSAEDPEEALREQLEYFDRWCEQTGRGKFSGLKILLVQASPERARVFATRFPEFQVVVTAADSAQGTSNTSLTTDWKNGDRASSFVAVPFPYYDENKQQGIVHFGSILATRNDENSWSLTSQLISPQPVPSNKAVAAEFWERLGEVLPQCLPNDFTSSDRPSGLDRIKWLTLCFMREETGADIAMLQKRDFFDQLPIEAGETREHVQQILDRLIWKGDLLTLLYVPGSAIKKALQQSKGYEAEEASPLSLAEEKSRKLEYLGIKYKSASREYLINEVPIEDKRIYSIATSDYLEAGDTGYPDLAAAALNPRTHPAAFPSRLKPISMVVCRRLYPREAKSLCSVAIDREEYLDKSIAEQTPPYKPPSFGKKFWDIFPFNWPAKDSRASSTSVALQDQVQQRPIWTLSLRNFSVGFNGLTKNISDADIAAKFSGIPTPGVTAKKNSSITAQLDTRLSRTSHTNESFVAFGADYKETSTGDVAPQIVQNNNRGTADAGVIRGLRGGRSQTRVGLALYLHTEAPLQKPFSTFALSGQDKLKIAQDRNYLLLPRAGLRWQHSANSFEGGIQAGREINAFDGYRFSTQGKIVECPPSSAETFAACVNRLIKAGTVTKDSVASAILDSRSRAGFYSRITFSIPFSSKMKYELKEEGDLFFNFHRDNAIDTRFRDISSHSLKFTIWPSLSVGPTLRLLLYKNKVNGIFLFQRQFGFETSLSFDLFNRREKTVQLKHKP